MFYAPHCAAAAAAAVLFLYGDAVNLLVMFIK